MQKRSSTVSLFKEVLLPRICMEGVVLIMKMDIGT